MALFTNPIGSQIVTGTPESVAARYAGLEQQAGESLRDYYTRLRATREGGILGTSGLPPAMPKEESTVAEEAVKELTCPDGYILQDGACVPAGRSGDTVESVDALPTVRWEAGDDPFGTGLNYGGYTTGLAGGQGMTGDAAVDMGFGLMNYGGKIVGALTNPLLGKLVEAGGGWMLDNEIDKRAASIDALTPNVNDPAYANPAGFDEPAITVSDKYGNVRTLTGSQVGADLDLVRNTMPSGNLQSGLFDSNAFGNADEAKAVLEFGLGSDQQFKAIDDQFASLPVTTGSTKTTSVSSVLSTPTSYYQPAVATPAPQYMDFGFTNTGTSGLNAEEQALSQALATGSDSNAYNSGGLMSDAASITQVSQDAFEQAMAQDAANRSNYSSSSDSGSSYSAPSTQVSQDEFEAAMAEDTSNRSSSSSSSDSGGGSSGTYCCTAMRKNGDWTSPKRLYRMHKWHYDQPQWWRDGYDVWGKVLADNLLQKKGNVWSKIMNAFYEHRVAKKPASVKSVIADVMVYPAVFVIGMTKKLTGKHVDIVEVGE
jgi:hypothetical protein